MKKISIAKNEIKKAIIFSSTRMPKFHVPLEFKTLERVERQSERNGKIISSIDFPDEFFGKVKFNIFHFHVKFNLGKSRLRVRIISSCNKPMVLHF